MDSPPKQPLAKMALSQSGQRPLRRATALNSELEAYTPSPSSPKPASPKPRADDDLTRPRPRGYEELSGEALLIRTSLLKRLAEDHREFGNLTIPRADERDVRRHRQLGSGIVADFHLEHKGSLYWWEVRDQLSNAKTTIGVFRKSTSRIGNVIHRARSRILNDDD